MNRPVPSSIHSFPWRQASPHARRPWWSRSLATLLAVAVVVVATVLGFTLREQRGIEAAHTEANHRLNLFASAVDGVIKRLEPVPATIQLNQDVLALLREPGRAARVAAVDDYLRRLNAHVGSLSAFVINDRGVVLASSNNGKGDDSSVGQDISFRPYFLEALSGRVGRHFALGIQGSQPGYFVSHPIHDGARVVGVAAIKINLEPIDQTWDMLGAPGLLADTNQVVILTSNPAWRYTSLTELPLERRVDLQMTRMYNNMRLQRFPIPLDLRTDEDVRLLDYAVPPRSGLPQQALRAGGASMLLGRTLDGMDWRLLVFVDLKAVRSDAYDAGFMAAIAAGFVMLLVAHLMQRRRILRQRLETEQMLERVNAGLERMVEDRTADLTTANDRLRTEVAEREQAESTLRATQNELVHAAKMAVLGQMATGITHELTQPLGAIRTLSGNALEFQRRGDNESVAGNLEIIARLTEQMGNIIHPLKSFARKSPPVPSRVDPAQAITNALFLYHLSLRRHDIQVVNRCKPGRLFAWCDQNQLEQVLINLIGNAMDAMVGMPRRVLTLHAVLVPDGTGDAAADAAQQRVRIDVQDTGTGLSEEARAHLFEPFFTTKHTGAGLGLGLVISRDIVRRFGGDIHAAPGRHGGTVFSVLLPQAQAQAQHPPAPPPGISLEPLTHDA